MKQLVILGSTGSIGTQALDVVRHKRDEFNVVALSAHSNINKLVEQVKEFSPEYVVIMNENLVSELKDRVSNIGTKVLSGVEGLEFISTLHNVDIVLTSVVGMIGLRPTIAAIREGKDIALANKETLVVGGSIIKDELSKSKSRIIPVDSEHSALFQCLNGESRSAVNNLILTASGGPFRGKKKEDLTQVTPEMALKHPRWNMGRKISIDSATLMNKGLEVIEAHYLFDVDYDNIKVVIHPQSIIHSMVEYKDGSIIAQLSNTDMRHPIQYALEYPNRTESLIGYLDLIKYNTLTFEEPDIETFECLKLAYEAGKVGGTMPAVCNIANEEAVDLFLNNKIKFLDIPIIIKEAMNNFKVKYEFDLEYIINLEKEVREYIRNIIK
ncbi:1-deoxy-D-xylulose-5-phosphate reductoisomerase [Caloramator proteoclasticus]|uniref:1-deoxy-D-xylulose 5-phosphate reductoisomerase n=1 Tax=Caloramator proteoclasticus DSM 10124 TaxID=1121262 RepID=A0A1M4SL92_9CLOT|nr:1-deoxy-D-xylulose-5-phosphate reductoisomerase [Caloramator proteoclasticus]SHE33044.1 1-deoxy-D-xylulose 5-phosphate reductoisomerase [Caloramator proteoclasticus DSM 10124]